jgi:hypothetical protein
MQGGRYHEEGGQHYLRKKVRDQKKRVTRAASYTLGPAPVEKKVDAFNLCALLHGDWISKLDCDFELQLFRSASGFTDEVAHVKPCH